MVSIPPGAGIPFRLIESELSREGKAVPSGAHANVDGVGRARIRVKLLLRMAVLGIGTVVAVVVSWSCLKFALSCLKLSFLILICLVLKCLVLNYFYMS